jgi:hypothetical protein
MCPEAPVEGSFTRCDEESSSPMILFLPCDLISLHGSIFSNRAECRPSAARREVHDRPAGDAGLMGLDRDQVPSSGPRVLEIRSGMGRKLPLLGCRRK